MPLDWIKQPFYNLLNKILANVLADEEREALWGDLIEGYNQKKDCQTDSSFTFTAKMNALCWLARQAFSMMVIFLSEYFLQTYKTYTNNHPLSPMTILIVVYAGLLASDHGLKLLFEYFVLNNALEIRMVYVFFELCLIAFAIYLVSRYCFLKTRLFLSNFVRYVLPFVALIAVSNLYAITVESVAELALLRGFSIVFVFGVVWFAALTGASKNTSSEAF
jgi:hypothetical protein